MKLNESKSKATIIRRKRRREKSNIFLNNRSLGQVGVMKYLSPYRSVCARGRYWGKCAPPSPEFYPEFH